LAAPRVNYLFPAGGQRGTTVKVTLSGSDLKDIAGFYTTGAGLSAAVEPATGDAAATTRTLAVTIAPDAPLGIQQVRVWDASGLSNVRYFRVGYLPERAETEPNDSPKNAEPVTLPLTLNGRIQQGTDRDGVSFSAKPGQTIVCEIEALRVLGQVGDSWLKGYLEIQDEAGNVLAESSGTPDEYYRWDPLIAFDPPREGKYTVFYRDLNWRGDAKSVYRLTVGVVPHAIGLFPLGGQRGTNVNVHFAGPNLDDKTAVQTVALPTDPAMGDTLDVAWTNTTANAFAATNLRPLHVADWPDVAARRGQTEPEPRNRAASACSVRRERSACQRQRA
jgi:hypothetical protein